MRASMRELGTRDDLEGELDETMDQIQGFWKMEPDEVMQVCAALSARLTQLEVLLHRVESHDKEYRQIRTMQVAKILSELDRQFKIASRLVEIRRQDIALVRGSV